MPLTIKGALALKLNLHRSLADHLPESTVVFFKDIRSKFYAFRYGDGSPAKASGAVSPEQQGN